LQENYISNFLLSQFNIVKGLALLALPKQ
jgi:hypothetical protein